MTWDYRIIKHEEDHPEETWFSISEVYYEDNEPSLILSNHSPVVGDSIIELHNSIEKMKAAFEKSVIEE